MSNQPQKSVALIAGPTASGKSALALRLARERDGMIINADSMQVYRELRILSARPTLEEEAQAPHRLYGHVSGGEDYSVARWLLDATREIGVCWAAGKLPIICGGTGLYFMALEQGLSDVPPIPAMFREKWRGSWAVATNRSRKEVSSSSSPSRGSSAFSGARFLRFATAS